jgi:hypothetical protein
MKEGRTVHYHIISDAIEEENEVDEFTFYHKEFFQILEKEISSSKSETPGLGSK